MMEPFAKRPVALILEDEAIIALNLQDELQDAGFGVGGPFTACQDALAWLRAQTPDVAVLDTVLKDGPCVDVAVELARKGVPFLSYSGHMEDRDLLADFHHVSWTEKPVPPASLVEECRRLLAMAA